MRWFSSVSAHLPNRIGGIYNFILPRFSIASIALASFVLLMAAAERLLEIAA
jgi:hypothetical protein